MSINARILASLSTPLVFFYLGWVHENQIIGGDFELTYTGNKIYTIFSNFYQIKAIPIMGNPFNAFFPILMMCISFLSILNILNKILVTLKCPGLQFGKYDDISDIVLEEGKIKMSKRKKLIKKAYKNMLEQLNNGNTKNTDKNKNLLREFFKGFFQQSKFHCATILLTTDDNNVDENLDGSSLTLTQNNLRHDIVKFGKRVGSFSDMFKRYGVKVVTEDENV
jgi:hypothetical protein